MKKSKFTESAIQEILKEQMRGKGIAEICNEYKISQATFYDWRARYTSTPMRNASDLKIEISHYKKIVAEQMLEISLLREEIDRYKVR